VLVRLLGLILATIGVSIAVRARRINDWALQLNRDWFGWEPGQRLSRFGLVGAVATGLVMAGLGFDYLVRGADAIPD
jgi:hypothetical protein